MKLKLRACSPEANCNYEYGTMVLKDNIILEFIEDENIGYLKMKYGEHYFPIQPNTYTLTFLNEINEHHKNFKATIHIKDSFMLNVKLNNFEVQQLKWMNKQHWIQKQNNVWIIIPIILTLIGLVITYLTA
jgi:maltooligosyltrehalose synthase